MRSTEVQLYLIRNEARAEEETAKARGDRSYEEFAQSMIVGTPEQVAEQLRTKVEAGINYFNVYMPRVAYELEKLHLFAEEVIPRLR